MTYETRIKEHYAAVKLRLMGPVKVAKIAAIPKPAGELEPVIKPKKKYVRKKPPKPVVIIPPDLTIHEFFENVPSPKSRKIMNIFIETCAKHDVRLDSLRTRSRATKVSHAKHEICYRLRNEIIIQGKNISFPAIGMYFNGMDHTSIMHGYKKHAERMRNETT